MTNSEIDLSIVIISYNTKTITRDCLISLYDNPPGCSYEVILVDNNSEDGSAEMVATEFPNIRLIKNKDNRGFAAANNQGFDISSGKYTLLLNSDTVVLKDVIQKSVDYLIENEDVGAMGCRVLNTDLTTQFTCSMFPSNLNLLIMTLGLNRLKWPRFLDRYQMVQWDRDTIRDVDVISGCYLLTHTKILKDVGYLDEDFFFFGEETEWCDRVKRSGWKLHFAPVGEIIHHGGASAKKLNYKRDLMLTDATIILHQKAKGALSAFICFWILTMFNVSRAMLWTVLSMFNGKAKERATHFRNVAVRMFSTWPKGSKI